MVSIVGSFNMEVGINQRNKERIYIRYKGIKMFRSRAVWIKHNGEIPKDMMIHHINGDKRDDRIENLQCVSRKEHGELHRKPNRKRIVYPSGAIKVVKL